MDILFFSGGGGGGVGAGRRFALGALAKAVFACGSVDWYGGEFQNQSSLRRAFFWKLTAVLRE